MSLLGFGYLFVRIIQEDKKYCLQEALRINPNNEHVKKALEQMQLNLNSYPTTLREMGVIEHPIYRSIISKTIPNQ